MKTYTQRQTGDTTRNILNVILGLSKGEKILVICTTHHMAAFLRDKIVSTIKFLQPFTLVSLTASDILVFGGSVKVIGIALLDSIRGQKYDTLIVDGGTLDNSEIAVLAPLFPNLSASIKPLTVKKKKKKLELSAG